ncbi:MAG: 50S ribosomal protein L11 methyltransferase [Armatimonadota bacterium]
MRWAEITVNSGLLSSDAVSNIFIEEGCGGASVHTGVGAEANTTKVVAYLPVDDRLETRLQSIKDNIRKLPEYGLALDSDEISVKWVEDEDWATAWKSFFKPIKIGKILIKPSWEEYTSQDDDIVIEIDPGMAFGTGNHPTTQLCLLAMQDIIKGGEIFLDMGAGSGILSMAAAYLGAEKIYAVEIDPIAVAAMNKNVSEANLEDKIDVILGSKPNEIKTQVDIIIANIIADVIIPMADDFAGVIKNNGILIVSGIINDRADEVSNALASAGFEELDRHFDGDWVLIISKKSE